MISIFSLLRLTPIPGVVMNNDESCKVKFTLSSSHPVNQYLIFCLKPEGILRKIEEMLISVRQAVAPLQRSALIHAFFPFLSFIDFANVSLRAEGSPPMTFQSPGGLPHIIPSSS